MAELRAAIEGCDVRVELPEQPQLGDDLRAALIEVAEAMHETMTERARAESEVEGFSLGIGDLGLRAAKGPEVMGVSSCWGYYNGSCAWYTRDDSGQRPGGCGIYAVNKAG
ncbi:MAG: hypothetical protein R2713_17340 [Ilumatobacteraceae bacterium]|nr:hypothetical protein [Acidimicrobiales bacterium]MCB9393732.1 hypothetical protein [Acidimicrobiaceae bacterium]